MADKSKNIDIPIPGGITVSVPDSIDMMTPYILQEQGDWFEDEIHFVRAFISPGMNVIDIGASYGLYTLSMAAKTGTEGKVLSFEPTSSVAEYLGRSISKNGFTNVELVKAGLSSRSGSAKLFLKMNPELNSLQSEMSGGSYETVPLTSLDESVGTRKWERIDFIKLDAEGEEIRIIDGGVRTLDAMSPLIMYELKQGDAVNVSPIDKFASIGYRSYRLVPGLGILIPFEGNLPFDGSLLNLFSCKDNTAKELERQGMLLREISPIQDSAAQEIDNSFLREWISAKPYGAAIVNKWFLSPVSENRSQYEKALAKYLRSISSAGTARERFAQCSEALAFFLPDNDSQMKPSRLLSFTRIAAEMGERARALQSLSFFINNFARLAPAAFSEPFLPPGARYDTIEPGQNAANWLTSCLLEQFEKLRAFSSYYTGETSLPILEKLETLGFQSEEMRRRLMLVKKRFKR